jgi:glycosyltransferase involved in cell wall biosynthesis
MSNAVILFHPDGYNTSVSKLMGRQAAGESFLRGFFQHGNVDRFHLWNWGGLAHDQMDPIIRRIWPVQQPVGWIGRDDRMKIAEVGCVFTPGPGNSTEAWMRRVLGPNLYSICGITHTTASAGAMDAMAALVTAPVEPWDALICTSKAVKDSTERQLALLADYLRERLAPSHWPTVRLETIPLGVNAVDFQRSETHRKAWRDKLGIGEDEIVVLFVGRFSFHGKMNPLPMALAMEQAAKAYGKPVHWIWSGWAHSEQIMDVSRALMSKHAPSVKVQYVDGRDAAVRFPIWSIGDVFLSLSDNIQETFGLTPVEAMAAGIPTVISDWDGYRDTVRDGIDGFRIPTHAPRRGMGLDLAIGHASERTTYDSYIGRVSQFAACNIDLAAEALLKLFKDPELRRTMGAAAQKQARDVFDWKSIIPRYQALWSELNAVRRSSPTKPAGRTSPWRPDPFTLFGNYPTALTGPETLVALRPGVTAETAIALLDEDVIAHAQPVLPNAGELVAMVARLLESPTPLTVDDIVKDFPPRRRGIIERGVTFLAKYGCVTLSPIPSVLRE